MPRHQILMLLFISVFRFKYRFSVINISNSILFVDIYLFRLRRCWFWYTDFYTYWLRFKQRILILIRLIFCCLVRAFISICIEIIEIFELYRHFKLISKSISLIYCKIKPPSSFKLIFVYLITIYCINTCHDESSVFILSIHLETPIVLLIALNKFNDL